MMIRSIPAFPVRDIDTGAAFYTSCFGFDCQYKDSRFALLRRGEVELHLWKAADKRWKWRSLFLFLRPIRSGAESFIAGTHSCRIEVEDIDAIYEEMKATKVLYGPDTVVKAMDWGTREFATLDLHGNLLTFFQPNTRSKDP